MAAEDSPNLFGGPLSHNPLPEDHSRFPCTSSRGRDFFEDFSLANSDGVQPVDDYTVRMGGRKLGVLFSIRISNDLRK